MKEIQRSLLLFLVPSMMLLQAQKKEEYASKFTAAELNEAPVKLIPYPQLVRWNKKTLEVDSFTIIDETEGILDQNFEDRTIELLAEFGVNTDKDADSRILFQKGTAKTPEGYQLEVNKKGLRIVAETETGFFYGLQTLRQLIQPSATTTQIPFCEIVDWPEHKIRGYMIDTGRNFHSMSLLKKQLDYMAQYKLNTFHWHLTDRPAWRIESKVYPQLVYTNNHRQTRDPGMYYTYDDIRELIAYARERQIRIIPEIDMPGHSDSFRQAMKVRMESAEGMEMLKNILDEFFTEIPKEDCPIIHIGSDEVHIKNPQEFIKTMVDHCTNQGREVIVWHPGLQAENHVIRQTWVDKEISKGDYREIDSNLNYVNGAEPMEQVQRLFFKPIGFRSENNILGGILCFWPDINLIHEEDAYKQNPVYSSLLTYAWATWTADMTNGNEYYFRVIPEVDTEAFNYFKAFENYLLTHKERYFSSEPFPYFRQTDKFWQIYDPVDANTYTEIDAALAEADNDKKGKQAIGNTLIFKERWSKKGYFEDREAGDVVFAKTYIYSDEDKEIGAMIGFETALRANKIYSGVPELGSWDPNGGAIWVNDEFVEPPHWENAGWKPSKQKDWGNKFEQEIPWEDQDFYWTRTPTKIKLKKGWNKVIAKVPYGYEYQNWMFTFIPVTMEGLRFSPTK